MRRFIIQQSDAEFTSHSGFALIGMALNSHGGLPEVVEREVVLEHNQSDEIGVDFIIKWNPRK